ncbi:MAG: HIT domain-containing protein [Ignavibacteriaceae bacterium]|nr:HIT domain-containing protein [Ignavibacteriaceae bacterium]
MEKMWSTWRSQYIESFKSDKVKPTGCIFCTAIEEDINDESSLLIEKNENHLIIMNLYPYNNGHLMVVPNRHTSDFNSLTLDELTAIMKSLQRCSEALKAISSPEGFNIGANIGKVSGAGIADHIHFHIVPRWNGDTNFMPVIGQVKVLSQDLLKTKKLLIEALKNLK